MKVIVMLSLFALATAYTELDDSLDFKELVASKRKLQKFIDCLMDYGPCSEQSVGYRNVVQEAVETACAKCTDYQRFTLYTFLSGMKSEVPEQFELFKEKFDPEDVYVSNSLSVCEKYKDLA